MNIARFWACEDIFLCFSIFLILYNVGFFNFFLVFCLVSFSLVASLHEVVPVT